MVDDALRAELSARRPWPRPRRSATSAPAPSSSSPRSDGTLLVPRDQHPAAGRAPGHRVRHRPRPGRRAAADRGGGAAGGRPRPSRAAHAIEVRLYAEDPAAGLAADRRARVHRFAVPGVRAEFDVLDRPGVRLDAGVVDGTPVGTAYDPMLAKVIAWAPDPGRGGRPAGRRAGRRAACTALATNRDLLVRTLRHPEFLAGRTDTGFFDRHRPRRARRAAGRSGRGRAGRAGRGAGRRRRPAARARACSGSCRAGGGTSRPSRSGRRSRSAGETVEVGYRHTPRRPGRRGPRRRRPGVARAPDEVVLEVAGVEHRLAVASTGDAVDVDGAGWSVALRALPRFPDPAAAVARGIAGRADARRGDRGARRGGRRRSRPGSRCSCSRR